MFGWRKLVFCWPPFAITNSPSGASRRLLGNSRMSAVCANAFENSSCASASPVYFGSRRRQMPLRSKTKISPLRIASDIGSCRPEAKRRQRTVPPGSCSPRTIHTSPSTVTPTPVPSGRNWMSPRRTSRRHGFSRGSAMSSTTYASFAVEGFTVVMISCDQRRRAPSPGIPRGAITGAAAMSASAMQKFTGLSCSGTRTIHIAVSSWISAVRWPIGVPTEMDATVSSTAPLPFGPIRISSGFADGPTSTCRSITGCPSCSESVVHSRTSAPCAVYSSTTPFFTWRTALNFPIATGSGPRPTSSGLGAGSRGSFSAICPAICQPG